MSQDFEVESLIINSPFVEPQLRWVIEKGKPPVKADGHRRASYFYRVPEHAGRGRKNKAQQEIDFEADKGEQVEIGLVNDIRDRIKNWRKGTYSSGLAYDGASSVTKELLELWHSDERMQRLFFAQIEAVQTIIFLVEAHEIYKKGLPEIPKDDRQLAPAGEKGNQHRQRGFREGRQDRRAGRNRQERGQGK